MGEEQTEQLNKNITAIGRLLWEKDLASGLNGNISVRNDEETLLVTAHGTCLGLLHDNNILKTDTQGELLEEGQVSIEKLLHTEIYKNFPDIQAVIHTHTTYTNAYFLENEKLIPRIFEAKVYLGEVGSIEQNTPAVTDAAPVIEQLKNNNIVVLRNHGVVAMGKDLFDCFLLIQALEEAVKTDAISRLYASRVANRESRIASGQLASKKYKLFSQEQIDDIVKLVNDDEKMKKLGAETSMNMDLAVKLDETGQVYRFSFQNGQIKDVAQSDDAEFVINAPENIWRSVFNREIDPFVATTQKKMNLKGDFAKISKWYAPCSRIFELWAMVPVE